MKKNAILFTTLIFAVGCSNNNAPDVSNIPVDIKIERFEKFLFEKTDTNNIAKGISEIQSAFPFFSNDFITNILGLPAINPETPDSAQIQTYSEIKRFIRLTRPIYDSLSVRYNKTEALKSQLEKAFKYVKYYFPAYKIPVIVTYLGPLDAPAVAITNDALAIGLQLYAGKDFPFYTSTQGQELYPMYISRRFEPQYIPVDCMKALAEDLFPDRSSGRPLIEQIIEKGKQWYLLNKFLPNEPDTLKTGFTSQQLNWCTENEGLIWNAILQGTDIYTIERSTIKNYIGEAPGTEGMPASAPGNIGQWIGWKIVETYSKRNKDLDPGAIMKTEPRKIFIDAKYKPK